MTAGHCHADMGNSVFMALGDALRQLSVNEVLPYDNPNTVMRHVLCVHVVKDLPFSRMNDVMTSTIKRVSDSEFICTLLKDSEYDIQASCSLFDGSREGTFSAVIVQAVRDAVDIWRVDNPSSPAKPELMKLLQRRLKKVRKQKGRLRDFQMGPEPTKPTPEEEAADRALDEEFASLSFEDLLQQTKEELGMSSPPPPLVTSKKEPQKPAMTTEERERKRAEIAAKVAAARAEAAAKEAALS
jgi:hypothetical protein